MKRTVFFVFFFVFTALFGVYAQSADSSFENNDRSEAQNDPFNDPFNNPFNAHVNDPFNDPIISDTYAGDPYDIDPFASDPFAIESNDPLIRQNTVQESSIETAPIKSRMDDELAAEEIIEQQQPVQTTQTPSLQPAQAMPPPSVQPAQTPSQSTARTAQNASVQSVTPLTWELVNLLQNSNVSLNDLNYFLSKSFTMIISEQYDNPKIDIRNGAIVVDEQSQVSSLVFMNNIAGKLHGFPVSGSIDVFEVVFKTANKDVAMRFRKTQANLFELFSAVIETRPYTLHSDEGLPLLSVSSNMNRSGDSQVQAFPIAGAASSSAARSRNVEGAGSLNKKGVVDYIKTQRPPLSDNEIEKIVQTYIDECAFENINHDIAIAQMLHASNFLKNRERVSGFNYSGLIELPNWNGKFSGMTEGVRAHIQHIKGYASKTLNRQQIVDPRYYLLVSLKYLGTVKTFDQLYEKWTSNPANYKQNIERILTGLYRYSSR